MAGKTSYWTFADATERDTYNAPLVGDGDLAVTINDGQLWTYDGLTSTWQAAGLADLASVLTAGNITGGSDIVVTSGDALYTEAQVGGYPTRAKTLRRVFTFAHTPGSPGGIVDFGPQLYSPDLLGSGLSEWGGWCRLVGSVAWEDGIDSQRDLFVYEGPVSQAGSSTPIVMQGLMRSAFPGATDYGAMMLQAPGSVLQLRGRDWNDAFQRQYALTLELTITDGRTQA